MKKTIKDMNLFEFSKLISELDNAEYIIADCNNYQITNYNMEYTLIFTNIIVNPSETLYCSKRANSYSKFKE